MEEVYTRFIGDFDDIKLLAVDTETLDMDEDDLFTSSSEKYTLDIFSVSGRKGDTYYYGAFPKEMFKDFFYKNVGKRWIFHNAGYDLKVIRKYGLAWDSVVIEDTMVMAQLLGHTKWGYGLKDLRVTELGLPRRKGYEDIDKFNQDEYYTYAALDTLDTLKLYEALMPRIIDEKLVEVYAIERDVVYVVSDMEWEGVGIDVMKMASTKPFLQAKIAPIEDALNILTHYVDINSPKQLQKFFYIDRGVEPKPEWLTTAGKNKRKLRNKKDRSEEEESNFQAGKYDETIYDFSVGVDTLTDLMERDDDIANIASLILEYRKYTKLISTFIDGFIPKLLKGRIHGRLLPFGADSGRFCIGRGTKISMPGEEKNIEDVNIGDLVYCYDDTGKLAIRKVTNKWNTGVKKVCRSFYRSKGNHKVISLVSTYDHKIRKADLSYVEVQKLVKNERVLHLTKDNSTFVSLEDAGELECWDIEVEDFYNFIANEVCVHNSSKDPNLQNIAADDYDDSGNSIRGFFIPRKGRKFITADYSQVELRMTGLCSGDPIITKAYVSGEDMHSTTAKNLNIDRKPSKTVNFGILYGMQGPTLRAGLKKAGAIVALADAERFIKKYWETYTKVKAMFDYVTEQIMKLGYVRTISGRKRRAYEISESTLKGLRNSLVQGGSGELMKVALVRLWKNMDRKRAAIVLTVHDELTVEADEDYVEECSKIVKWAMEEILPTNIKFCCNMNTGYSWAESK